MESFIIKKGSIHSKMDKIKIAVLASFTIINFDKKLEQACNKYKIISDVYIAPYQRYAQEILNLDSDLYEHDPGIVFLMIDVESFLLDYYSFPYRYDGAARRNIIESKSKEIINLINTIKDNTDATIVINSFKVPQSTSMGILENKQEYGFLESIQDLNEKIKNFTKNESRVFLFDLNTFYSRYGSEIIEDKRLHYLADMKFSDLGLEKISGEYVGYMIPKLSLTKKCLVLDLDNTLWGGVIGEDGIEGIKLGLENEGRLFLDFQKKILNLFERGVILAINSKNNLDDVKDVFERHEYMLLKEKHFASIKINWQDKATNMKEIAQELNIGTDSLIFLDDDKFNRELIRQTMPEVLVVDLPEDTAQFPAVIDSLPWFNTFQITQEDLKKGEMYVQQRKREEFKNTVTNVEEFLKNLNMLLTFIQANKFSIPRISQLTKKTNQFNLTTKRYSEDEIETLSQLPEYLVRAIKLEDRFGDNGLTGVVIIKKGQDEWSIDSLLLSCRILGRRVEFALMEKLITDAKKENVHYILGSYIPTKKNAVVKNFYSECGFVSVEETEDEIKYKLDLSKTNLDNIIKTKEFFAIEEK